MIKIFKAGNVDANVILITLPGWKTYRDKLDEKRLEFMIKTCENISRKHHVIYLNFLTDTLEYHPFCKI